MKTHTTWNNGTRHEDINRLEYPVYSKPNSISGSLSLSGVHGAQGEGGMTGRVSPTHLSPVWRRSLRKSSQGETFLGRSGKEWEKSVGNSVSRGDRNRAGAQREAWLVTPTEGRVA